MILKPHKTHHDREPCENKRDSAELTALIARAAGGDEDAFSALLERYEKMVYNLAFQYTQNREDAADVTQDTFIKLWRTLGSFRGDCSFTSWVFRITQNTALDYLRKQTTHQTVSLTVDEEDVGDRGRERDLVDDSPTHDPAAWAEHTERSAALQAAIASLRADHREILVLRDMQGFSYTEIAQMLGLEMGTVKSRISRARLQIKEFLEKRNFF
ncbi:MAG: sigma-70 family RNA polymerase sigma factor [Clostridia bacterium]|nr:sigma-70 family RNA polymerase sigma factor [Clostridia bacterium]